MRILKKLFPQIQFICATHSPFIIQSLEPDELLALDSVQDEEYSTTQATTQATQATTQAIQATTQAIQATTHASLVIFTEDDKVIFNGLNRCEIAEDRE